jgi:hypothetical protein
MDALKYKPNSHQNSHQENSFGGLAKVLLAIPDARCYCYGSFPRILMVPDVFLDSLVKRHLGAGPNGPVFLCVSAPCQQQSDDVSDAHQSAQEIRPTDLLNDGLECLHQKTDYSGRGISNDDADKENGAKHSHRLLPLFQRLTQENDYHELKRDDCRRVTHAYLTIDAGLDNPFLGDKGRCSGLSHGLYKAQLAWVCKVLDERLSPIAELDGPSVWPRSNHTAECD